MVPGDELRRRRQAQGWSEEEAARRIGYARNVAAGVKAISRWENGRTKKPTSSAYQEYVRLLTGVELVGLADLDARLRGIEGMLATITGSLRDAVQMLRAEQASYTKLDDGRLAWVARLDPAERLSLDPQDRRLLRKAVAMLEQAAD